MSRTVEEEATVRAGGVRGLVVMDRLWWGHKGDTQLGNLLHLGRRNSDRTEMH